MPYTRDIATAVSQLCPDAFAPNGPDAFAPSSSLSPMPAELQQEVPPWRRPDLQHAAPPPSGQVQWPLLPKEKKKNPIKKDRANKNKSKWEERTLELAHAVVNDRPM